MKRRLNVLQSKLSFSKATDTLERSRLIHVLQGISRKKLAMVVAGAGYGKTTLAAQTVENLAMETVWYCLDESDGDFATFMGYLVAGIRKSRPEFGKRLEEKLSFLSVSQRTREALLVEFLAEAETGITDPMVIVLDDYHTVQDSPEISGSLEFLLARLPRAFHLIVISRRDPAIRISRYRSMGEVIDVGEADLAFRIEEIGLLSGKLLDGDMGAAKMRKLLEKTGGWAAALILYFNALKGAPPGDPAEPELDTGMSKRFVFQYLEENIFEKQSMEMKDFMVKSSLLSRLHPGFCDEVFNRRDSREILQGLCENHLLTFPCGQPADGFQYHHLLRDFLRERLERDLGITEVRRLRRDIGKSMEQRGDIHGALHHFLEGMHFEEACRIIAGMALMDFIDCPLRFIMDAFHKIPEAMIRSDARLLCAKGRLSSLNGDIREAIDAFQGALARFRTDGNSMGVANCLKDLGFHYYLTGDVARAKKQLEGLREREHGDPFFPAEVTGYLILFSAILGRMEEADHDYDAFWRSPQAGKADKSLVRPWLNLCYNYRFHNSGDFDKAHRLNLKAMDAFTRMGMEIFLPLSDFHAALTLFYKAQPEEGYGYAEKGLLLAEENGIHDHQYAWLLYARALNGFGKGALDGALLDAEESLELFKNHDNFWGQATVYELLAMISRMKGKLSEAEGFLRAGWSVVERLGLAVTEGALALGLAEVMADKGEYAHARCLLDTHRKEIEVSKFHLFRCFLLHSRIHAGLGTVEKALEAMETALTMAQENAYEAWIVREPAWVVPVLVRCYALGIMAKPIERILAGADCQVRDALWFLKNEKNGRIRRAAGGLMAVLPRKASAPLEIRCLGKFTVFVGGREIPRNKWRSAAAVKLFKYLAMRRDQGFIPKEVLLELAWPDEDPAKTTLRFHVALSTMRRLLEPGLKRGVPSSYILREKDAYRLEIGKNGTIDTREFLKDLELAERVEAKDPADALARYLRAESIYGGALFEEDPYEDWLMEHREMLQARYLHALSRIIHLYEEKAAWEKCINHGEKYLAMDPYAEPVYRSLMQFHSRLGQTSRIMKVFQRCQSRVTEDLGCPLNEDTVALYRMLTGKMSG